MLYPTISQRTAIALFLLYVAVIYLTLPFIPGLVAWIKNSYGLGAISYITPSFAAVLTALMLFLFLRRRSSGRAIAGILPPVLAAWAVIFYLKGNPVEQIHVVEYGLLGFLAYLASTRRLYPIAFGSVIFWFVAVLAAGFIDEIIQHFLPNRVFDWRDVVINGISGLLGMAASFSARHHGALANYRKLS